MQRKRVVLARLLTQHAYHCLQPARHNETRQYRSQDLLQLPTADLSFEAALSLEAPGRVYLGLGRLVRDVPFGFKKRMLLVEPVPAFKFLPGEDFFRG